MRILHLTPSFQHPLVRGSHRHYHFLCELGRRHEVTLLALSRAPVPAEARENVASHAARVLTFGAEPGQRDGGPVARELALRRAVREMRKEFRALVEREDFDVVLFHGKSIFPVIAGFSGLPIVVDFCDATSMRVRMSMRHASRTRLPMLVARYAQVRMVERRLARKTPPSSRAFISRRDREAVLGPADRSPIVPNGVDLEYWTRKAAMADSGRVVFTGVMDYAANEDAAIHLIRDVLPRVRQSLPDVELAIVGRDPRPRLQALAREAGVTVTGFVDDMRPYLEQAGVCAIPLRYASGMQNKVLEAMAMEVPVLTTPVVADGLRLGEEAPPVATADGAEAFARRLVELLADRDARIRHARDGRRFVEENFHWAVSAAKIEAMCVAAVARTRTSRPEGHSTIGRDELHTGGRER